MRRMADLAAVLVVWAFAGTAVTETNASTMRAAMLVLAMNPLCIIKSPRLLKRMLPVRAIQHFFHKLHTLEIQDLRVLFLAPVERHADLPGTRKDARVFDGCLVHNF